MSHITLDPLSLGILSIPGCPLVSHIIVDPLSLKTLSIPGFPECPLVSHMTVDPPSLGILCILGFPGCSLVSHITLDPLSLEILSILGFPGFPIYPSPKILSTTCIPEIPCVFLGISGRHEVLWCYEVYEALYDYILHKFS